MILQTRKIVRRQSSTWLRLSASGQQKLHISRRSNTDDTLDSFLSRNRNGRGARSTHWRSMRYVCSQFCLVRMIPGEALWLLETWSKPKSPPSPMLYCTDETVDEQTSRNRKHNKKFFSTAWHPVKTAPSCSVWSESNRIDQSFWQKVKIDRWILSYELVLSSFLASCFRELVFHHDCPRVACSMDGCYVW
jgi:hypothetical protein